MNAPKGGWRLFVDSALIIAVLSLAFWTGTESEKVDHLTAAIEKRGGVQISMEADKRLTVLEEKIAACERK